MNRCLCKLMGCLIAIGPVAVESARGQPPGPQLAEQHNQGNQEQEGRLAALERRMANAESEINLLTNNQKALQQIAQELDTVLRQLVERGDAGDPYVSLRANMQQPEFREQLRGAVHESIDRVGTLRVENQAGTPQTLRVNDQTYQFDPFEHRDIPVPVGTVTTELIGHEAPKHLTVAPPNYFQRIVIRLTQDAARFQVRRPAEEPGVVYGSAVRVESPTVVQEYPPPIVLW